MKKKGIRIVFNSPVVLTFAAVCLAATVLGIISGGSISRTFFMTYRSSLLNPLTYLRAITHVFGHSGWDHFLGNMSFVLLLGPMLEEKYGSSNIVGIILCTAVVTAIVNGIFFPYSAIMGASGVVFAFILMTSFTEFGDGEIPITFLLVAALYLGKEIANGLFVRDNISQLAHIVGGITGAIFGYWWNKRSR
jgi:GlpG protein